MREVDALRRERQLRQLGYKSWAHYDARQNEWHVRVEVPLGKISLFEEHIRALGSASGQRKFCLRTIEGERILDNSLHAKSMQQGTEISAESVIWSGRLWWRHSTMFGGCQTEGSSEHFAAVNYSNSNVVLPMPISVRNVLPT